MVVIIQDAHANYEAQKNIAEILTHLAEKNGLKTVNVEGAQGYLYSSFLSAYPSKEARKAMAEYFMKEAKLTGPEYAAIVDRPELKLFGVEDETLYQENRKVFLEALDYKGQDEIVLAAIRKLLESVAKKVFSKELFELIKRNEDFRRENKNLISFIDYLNQFAGKSGVELSKYEQITQFLKLTELHSSINELEAEKEAEALVKVLGLPVESTSEALKEGFPALVIEAGKRRIDLESYPQAKILIQSLEVQKKIDIRLFDEVQELNVELRGKLFRNEEEKLLERLFKILEICEKIFDFSLTREDADFYFSNRQDFKMENFKTVFSHFQEALEWNGGFPEDAARIDTDLARIEKFYELALRRDKVLVDKTLSELNGGKEQVIALIAGGFHTAGFQRVLEGKGISHITVRPAITEIKDPEQQNRLYEASVRQEPEAFSQLLIRDYTRQKSSRLNDPRYQLRAHTILFSKNEIDQLLGQAGKLDLAKNLSSLIEQNPRLGANVTLALFTVIMDIKQSREAFNVQSRLESLLATQEDREFRRAVYGILLSDETEVYQSRTSKGGLTVFGSEDVIATIEPIRRRLGISSREYSAAVGDELRQGAVKAVVEDGNGADLVVLQQVHDRITRELKKLKAGPVLVKLALPALPPQTAKKVSRAKAASLGTADEFNKLNIDILPLIKQLSGELTAVNPSDADTLTAIALKVADLRKQYTSVATRIYSAMGKETLQDKIRNAIEQEIQNFNADILALEMKRNFMDYRNQLLALDISDTAGFDKLNRQIDSLRRNFNLTINSADNQIDRIKQQRPKKDSARWQEKERRLAALVELRENFPVQYLTQLRQYLALLRATQEARNTLLSGISASPQDWIGDSIKGSYGAASETARKASLWIESVEDPYGAVRQYVERTARETIDPAAKLADFVKAFRETVGLVNQARAVVDQESPDEKALIQADQNLTRAKQELKELFTFDLSGLPADRAEVIRQAFNALTADRTALRDKYNAHAKKVVTAREEAERLAAEAKAAEVARKREAALARAKRVEEIRGLVKAPFAGNADGLDAQMAETGKLLAELDTIRSETPRPPMPDTTKDLSVKNLNQVASLPAAAKPPVKKIGEVKPEEVREAVQEAAEHKETRTVSKGAVWKVVIKITGTLFGWAFKARKQRLTETQKEALSIANNELRTRQPARAMDDFLTGEALSQMGNAQILLQQSATANISELLGRTWDPTNTNPLEKKQELSESLIKQWVLRQYLEWSKAVDLDAKLDNTGIFIRRDGKGYNMMNFDHDELIGMNSTGRLTQDQFRKFFYYFWFTQVNELREMDQKNKSNLESIFHESVKQTGIFKTLYDDPAKAESLYRAFDETFKQFRARKAELKQLNKDKKAIREAYTTEKTRLANLKEQSRRPGAPAMGKEIDALEIKVKELGRKYKELVSQKSEFDAKRKAWLAYLDSLLSGFKIKEEFEAYVKDEQRKQKETGAAKDEKYRTVARIDETILEVRTRRLVLEVLQTLEDARSWDTHNKWHDFLTLDEKISHLESMLAGMPKGYYLQAYGVVRQTRNQFNQLFTAFAKKNFHAELTDIVSDLNFAGTPEETSGLQLRYEALVNPDRPDSLISRFPAVASAITGELFPVVMQVQAAMEIHQVLTKTLEDYRSDFEQGRKSVQKIHNELYAEKGIATRITAFQAAVISDIKVYPQSFWTLSASFNRQIEDFYAQILRQDFERIKGQFSAAKTGADVRVVLGRLQIVSTLAASWEGKALHDTKKTFSGIVSEVAEARSQFLQGMFNKRKDEVASLAGPKRALPLDAAIARLNRLDTALQEIHDAADPVKDAELIRDITMHRLNNLSNALKDLKALEGQFQKDFLGLLDKINDTLTYPFQKAAAPAKRSAPEQQLVGEWQKLRDTFRNELKGHAQFQSALALATDLLKLRQSLIDFKEPADIKARKDELAKFAAELDRVVSALKSLPLIGEDAAKFTGLKELIESRITEASQTVEIGRIKMRIEVLKSEFEALQALSLQPGNAAKFLDIKRRSDALSKNINDQRLAAFVPPASDLTVLSANAEILYIQTWLREKTPEIEKPLSLVELQTIQAEAIDIKKQLDEIYFLAGQGDVLKQSFSTFDARLTQRVNDALEFKSIETEVNKLAAKYDPAGAKEPIASLNETELAADRAVIEALLSPAAQAGQPSNPGRIQAFLQGPDRAIFKPAAKKLAEALNKADSVRIVRLRASKYFYALTAVTSNPDPSAQLKKIKQDFQNDTAKLGVYAEDIKQLIIAKGQELVDAAKAQKAKVAEVAGRVRTLAAVIDKFVKPLSTQAGVLTTRGEQIESMIVSDAPKDVAGREEALSKYVGNWKKLLTASRDFIAIQREALEKLDEDLQDKKVLSALQKMRFKLPNTDQEVTGQEIIDSFTAVWNRFVKNYEGVGLGYLGYSLQLVEISPERVLLDDLDKVQNELKTDLQIFAPGSPLLVSAASLGDEDDRLNRLNSIGNRIHRMRMEKAEKEVGDIRKSVNTHLKRLTEAGLSGGTLEYRAILNQLLFGATKRDNTEEPGYRDQIAEYQMPGNEIVEMIGRFRGSAAAKDFVRGANGINRLMADIDYAAFMAVEQWIRDLAAPEKLTPAERRRRVMTEEDRERLAEFIQRFSEWVEAQPADRLRALEKDWKSTNLSTRVPKVNEALTRIAAEAAAPAATAPPTATPPTTPPPPGEGVGSWGSRIAATLLANWKPLTAIGTVLVGVVVTGVLMIGGKGGGEAPGGPAPGGDGEKKDEGKKPPAEEKEAKPGEEPKVEKEKAPAKGAEEELAEAEDEFARRKAKLLEEHLENQKRQRQIQRDLEIRQELERMFPIFAPELKEIEALVKAGVIKSDELTKVREEKKRVAAEIQKLEQDIPKAAAGKKKELEGRLADLRDEQRRRGIMEEMILMNLRDEKTLRLGDPGFREKWTANADAALAREVALRKEIEDLEAKIKAAAAPEKGALEQKKEDLEFRRDFLKDYHQRIKTLIRSVAEFRLGLEQTRDAEVRAKMWQWTVDAFVRKAMEDKDEIRTLKARLVELEKERKASLEANKKGEAAEFLQQIQKISGKVRQLETDTAKRKQDFEDRKAEKEKREEVYRRVFNDVMKDATVPAAEKERTIESKYNKAWREASDALEIERLTARADAGDEAAKKELARRTEENRLIKDNAEFRKLNKDTREAFEKRFAAQVRAGGRQEWEERYDWKDTWQKALIGWYDKTVKDAGEKQKKKTEAGLQILENQYNWDSQKESQAKEAELRRYRVEWFEPHLLNDAEYNSVRKTLASQIAEKTRDMAKASPDSKKFYEEGIANLEAEMERMAYQREFAQAYQPELARQKGMPDIRDRMLDFRAQWLAARAAATTNAIIKKELEQMVGDIQALQKEIAEEKGRGKTSREIELEDYFFRMMRRRYEGDIRLLNKDLERRADFLKTLPGGSDESKKLAEDIKEREEKRDRFEKNLAELLVNHEWKVAKALKEDALERNPDRFTEILRFEQTWLKTKIAQLDETIKKFEDPAKKDAAVQRQLNNTKDIQADKKKRLEEVSARLISITETRRLNDVLEDIRKNTRMDVREAVKEKKLSFSQANLLREKAHLDAKIREKIELAKVVDAKEVPRVLAEIAALKRHAFTLDGFPYIAMDYPAFVEGFLLPWEKKLDEIRAKLRDFNERNGAKLLTDKKLRADQKRIEDEIILMRLDRLNALKVLIDRGEVEMVVRVVPPITIDVSEEATENLREASDLIQRDTVSVAGEVPLQLTAVEKAEIDKFVDQIKKIDQKGVIPELIEAGRWWSNDRWYKEFAKMFAVRPFLIAADRQPLRLRILKEWNEDFAAQVRVFSDPRFAAFRFRYRKVFGGEMVEPIMSDSWREINERNDSGLHLRLPLPTLMGMFQERVAIEEINTFQNKLTQLRIQRINHWLFNYNIPGSGRLTQKNYLTLMGQLYIGLYNAEITQLQSMIWTTPGGEEYLKSRIQFEQQMIGNIQTAAGQSDAVLAMALSWAAPIGIAPVTAPKGKGRKKDAVAVPFGADGFSNFAAALNNYYEFRNRLDQSLDVAYIRMADEYLKLAAAKRTPWQDARMVALENELRHFHEGKAPYHFNRRSSINVLTWYLQHSPWEENDWVARADEEAKKLVEGLYSMAVELRGLGTFDAYLKKLREPAGKEGGDSVRAIFQQRIQNIVSSIEDPILNQGRINKDLEILERRLKILYPLYSDTVLKQMARAYVEDFLVTEPESMTKGVTEKHLKFLTTHKEYFDNGGFETFKRLYGPDYGKLLNPEYLDTFLRGREETFKDQEMTGLRTIIQNMITPAVMPANKELIPVSPFAPEDVIRLRIILAQLDMIEDNPQAYWKSLYMGWKMSFFGAWDGASNIGPLQAKTLRDAQAGNDALAVRRRQLYSELAGLVGTYIRRDAQTTLIAQIREAEKLGIDTVKDVPDGRGGTKRGLLTKIENDIQLRRNLEIFIFGPKVLEGKVQKGVPARNLNLGSEDDLALLNTLEKGMTNRGITLKTLQELLEKVAGNYRAPTAEEKKEMTDGKRPKADVIYPFQEAIWELTQRLDGKKEPGRFPATGWPRDNRKERREFVAVVLSEAELYGQLGKEEYGRVRKELVDFLRKNPDAPESVLEIVHTTVRDVKNAFRPDGKPIKPPAPKKFTEASGLERGMVRAILAATSRPGGNLEKEINRIRLLSEIAKNKDHLRKTIDQAQEFYERIFGPTTKVPVINSETILQDNLAFSRYTDFLLLGIEESELPPVGAPAADLTRVVNIIIERWNENILKLNDDIAKHPMNREVMMKNAFLEVMAKKGWAPISDFDYDKGNFIVDRDINEFNRFRRQLAKMNFDVYISNIKVHIREGLPDAVPAPPVVAPVVGAFDGRLPLVPDLDAGEDAKLSALPILQIQRFPDGVLLASQHASLNWPVYVQREGKDAIHVFGYGRQQNTSGLIGEVKVWNGKAYVKFKIAQPNNRAEFDKFFRLEKGRPRLIPEASEKLMTSLLWSKNSKLKLNERAETVVWRKSLDDGLNWFDALTLRADGTVLLNTPSAGPQEFSLGLSGPEYTKMKVQHVKGMRVDDDGKLHLSLSLAGDRFTGDIYLTATYQESTGAMEINVKSSYKVRVMGKGKEKADARIEELLDVPVHQLTVLRIGATPEKNESITYHTVNGAVTKKVYEPGLGEAGDSRRFGNPNETFAATVKGKDGTLIDVKASPVAPAADKNPLEVRYEEGNRAQMPSNIPVQLTLGVPVQKKLAKGDTFVSDLTITVTPKPKAAKAEDIKPADLKAPAGWPAVPRKEAPTVSDEAKKMSEIEARTTELMNTMFGKKTLEAADRWYWALLYGLGPADPKPADAKGFKSLAKLEDKKLSEIQRTGPESYGRIRAFMSRIAERPEKKLEDAVDGHIKQMDSEIAVLIDKQRRKLLVATVILNDLALRGNNSEFISGIAEDDALKALREKMKKEKTALFPQILRSEEELKDFMVRGSAPADGKIWIRLDGVRYEVDLKVAGKISLQPEGGAVLGPFDNKAGTEITIGKDKYNVVSADDKEIKLRRQGAVSLNDLLKFDTDEAKQGQALLDRMIEYYETKVLRNPILQGKLSARIKAAIEKGNTADNWNQWLKATIDGLLRLRALEGPMARGEEARQDKGQLALYMNGLMTELLTAVLFVHFEAEDEERGEVAALSDQEIETFVDNAAKILALNQEANGEITEPQKPASAAMMVPFLFALMQTSLSSRLRRILSILVPSGNTLAGANPFEEEITPPSVQESLSMETILSVALLNPKNEEQLERGEQIASLTQDIKTGAVAGMPLLERLLGVFDAILLKSEASLPALNAATNLGAIRHDLELSETGLARDLEPNISAVVSSFKENLGQVNLNLDPQSAEILLRPLLAALGRNAEDIPADQLWQPLVDEMYGRLLTEEVINVAGNRGLGKAKMMREEEELKKEAEERRADMDRFQQNAALIDGVSQALSTRSKGQVTLVASLPVIDQRAGFVSTQFGRILANEKLPSAGTTIFLVNKPGEEPYSYSRRDNTLYFNLAQYQNYSQLVGDYRKAVKEVTAIIQPNEAQIEQLNEIVKERSNGRVTLTASPTVLADDGKTQLAVAELTNLLKTGTLPPDGTTIFLGDLPRDNENRFVVSDGFINQGSAGAREGTVVLDPGNFSPTTMTLNLNHEDRNELGYLAAAYNKSVGAVTELVGQNTARRVNWLKSTVDIRSKGQVILQVSERVSVDDKETEFALRELQKLFSKEALPPDGTVIFLDNNPEIAGAYKVESGGITLNLAGIENADYANAYSNARASITDIIQQNAEWFGILSQTIVERSNGQVKLTASNRLLAFLGDDEQTPSRFDELEKVLKNEAFPADGIAVIELDYNPEGEDSYKFNSTDNTLYIDLSELKNYSQFGEHLRSALSFATQEQILDHIDQLSDKIAASSDGQISLEASERLSEADDKETELAVRILQGVVANEGLPPNGTAIEIDKNPEDVAPYKVENNVITINLAGVTKDTDLAGSYRSAVAAITEIIQRNAARMGELSQAVATASKGQVTLKASNRVLADLGNDERTESRFGALAKALTQGPLPPDDTVISLEIVPYGEDVFRFTPDGNIMTLDLSEFENDAELAEFYNGAVAAVKKIIQRNSDLITSELGEIVSSRSQGQVTLQASNRLLANDEKTKFAVETLGKLLSWSIFGREKLPPNGTGLILDNDPADARSYSVNSKTFTLNLAKLENYNDVKNVFRAGTSETAKIQAASLGESAGRPELPLEIRKRLMEALAGIEDMQRKEVLTATVGIFARRQPIDTPGVLVIQGDKYYGQANAQVLQEHVEKLLASMPKRIIAISLNPTKITNESERQGLADRLAALKAQYGQRLIIEQASLEATALIAAKAIQLDESQIKAASMQFMLQAQKLKAEDVTALLNLEEYAAGRIVFVGDENVRFTRGEGQRVAILLADLVRAWQIVKEAEAAIARAA